MQLSSIPGGFFITIEGIDGAGKSTLARSLSEKLTENGYKVLVTREPGGTKFGTELRTLLYKTQDTLVPEASFLLFAADRAQHVETIIRPALHSGSIVISDRFSDSSLAYQGYGNNLPLPMIRTVNAWVSKDCSPALIFYLQISVEDALRRVVQRNAEYSFFEKKEFLTRVHKGFEEIFSAQENVRILPATHTPDIIVQRAYEEVTSWIKQR